MFPLMGITYIHPDVTVIHVTVTRGDIIMSHGVTSRDVH